MRPIPVVRRWRGWLPLVVLPGAVLFLTPDGWPRWAFMWILAFAIFGGCKWLTWRRSSIRDVPLWKQVGYLVAWPGLDADAFLSRHPSPAKPALREWQFGWFKFGVGMLLLFFAARVPIEDPYVTGWVGMVGIVTVLHFGTFHLLSCAWRDVGVNARPLMNWPLVAASLSEFWGRRWNTAFRDLTHRFLFRPLTGRLGARTALCAGFAFSGLVHDVVISLPAGGGYGGPTMFFLIQSAGLLTERSRIGRSLGLGRSFPGRLFTMTILLAPIGLLFHRPFVTGVVVPFLQAVKAV